MKLSKGQEKLRKELFEVIDEIDAGDYDDYTSKHCAPKTALVERLRILSSRVISGKYDN